MSVLQAVPVSVEAANGQKVIVGTLHRRSECVVRVVAIDEDDRLTVVPGGNPVVGDARLCVLGLPPGVVVSTLNRKCGDAACAAPFQILAYRQVELQGDVVVFAPLFSRCRDNLTRRRGQQCLDDDVGIYNPFFDGLLSEIGNRPTPGSERTACGQGQSRGCGGWRTTCGRGRRRGRYGRRTARRREWRRGRCGLFGRLVRSRDQGTGQQRTGQQYRYNQSRPHGCSPSFRCVSERYFAE